MDVPGPTNNQKLPPQNANAKFEPPGGYWTGVWGACDRILAWLLSIWATTYGEPSNAPYSLPSPVPVSSARALIWSYMPMGVSTSDCGSMVARPLVVPLIAESLTKSVSLVLPAPSVEKPMPKVTNPACPGWNAVDEQAAVLVSTLNNAPLV